MPTPRLPQRLRPLLHRIRGRAFSRVTHIWHEVPIVLMPPGDLPAGTVVQRARPDEARLVEELPLILAPEGMVDAERARRRMAAGHDLWIAFDGERPVVAFWTFYGTVPVLAARGRQMPLPRGVASIEDAVVAPEYAGRRIAPMAVCRAGHTLLREGAAHTLIMQALVGNHRSRNAIAKLGGREVATVTRMRFGPFYRVRVRPAGFGGFLAHHLEP